MLDKPDGLRVIDLVAHADQRGMFYETYQRDRYRALGIDAELVQDNFSSSARGVLRGLHYQLRRPQGKLVWVTHGSVFDVAVDLRRRSATFGRAFTLELSADNHRQLWIPPGFAHGFLVTSERADVAYKVSAFYDADDERAIAWNDPALSIAWPLAGDPLVSARDSEAPLLALADLP